MDTLQLLRHKKKNVAMNVVSIAVAITVCIIISKNYNKKDSKIVRKIIY